MIRGLYISRFFLAGIITMTVFACRAVIKVFPDTMDYIGFMVDPFVVFILFIVAGIIVVYPLLTGAKAIIVMPILVLMIAFFVYAYYIL